MAHLKEKEGWERSDFPILCETCLGDNPYVRMTKAEFDKECKICLRPFTVFRWRPGSNARYKKTEVCQTCAKVKNVCQTCLLDLEFGLPVQVRDTANPHADILPLSEPNREYHQDMQERKLQSGEINYGKFEPSPMIMKLARTAPYYKRNRAHVCSFFAKGECKRGSECPYRHEMPETGDLSVQNIKDRYYGQNDPVANKLLKKADTFARLTIPEDKDITTLYIGNVDPEKITENDLRDSLYSFGEIKTLKVVPHQMCAFVSYTTRAAAELAADKLFQKMYLKGQFLRVAWGKPPSLQNPLGGTLGEADTQSTFFTMPSASSSTSITSPAGAATYHPVNAPAAPGMGQKPYYPSADPNQYGARPNKEK